MNPYTHFYRTLGDAYDEEAWVYRFPSGKVRRAWLRERLRMWTGTLLDAGCGGGVTLADYVGGARIGVDLGTAALRRARERVAAMHSGRPSPDPSPPRRKDVARGGEQEENSPSCSPPHPTGSSSLGGGAGGGAPLTWASYFLTAPLEALPLADACVDGVVCTEVLEHIPEPAPALREMARVLVPGGRLLLTTPNWRGVGTRPTMLSGDVLAAFGAPTAPYFHTAYLPEELAALCEGVGLEVVGKGVLETELRLWGRPFAWAHSTAQRLNARTLASPTIARALYASLAIAMTATWYVMRATGVCALLRRVSTRGPRSWCEATKASHEDTKH